MTKKASISRMAQLARGALLVALPPVLAADAEIDLNAALKGVTKKNWAESKPRLLGLIKPKLAADAELADIVKLLDTLDKADNTEDEEPPLDTPPANDADPIKAACDMFKAKGATDAEVGAMAELLKKKAGDADPAIKPAADEEDDEEDDDKPKVTKGAMDAALKAASVDADKRIKLAADAAEQNTVIRLNAISAAREEVHPYVGKLAMSFDSAEGVYRAALDVLKVKHEGVHASALSHILAAQPKPNERRATTTLAADAAQAEAFSKRFPTVAAVRHV